MRRFKLVIFLCISGLSCACQGAFALPQGGVAEVGNVKIEQPTPTTLIIAASDKAIINFDSFQVKIDERVNFILSETATILVRVTGKEPVLIAGSLKTGGTVLFTTAQGIYLTPGASVDARRLLVSTLDLSTHSFLNSYYEFTRRDGSRAHIANSGVFDAGELTFISSSISNAGILQTSGRLNIATGDSAMLKISAQGPLDVEVMTRVTTHSIDSNGNSVQDSINNTGTLDVGQLRLQSSTAPGIFINGINQCGIVNARGIRDSSGELIYMRANRNIELCGRLVLAQREARATSEVISEGAIVVSQALRLKGNTVLCAQENIEIKGDVSNDSGNLSLIADSGLTGKGALDQAQGTKLTTLNGGSITIQASGDSRIAAVNSSGDLVLERGGGPVVFTQWPGAFVSAKGAISVRKGVKLHATTLPKQ